MRCDPPLYLSAPAVRLGEGSESAAEAVAAGLVTEETAARFGYRSLPLSVLAPVELAVACATRTLETAAVPPAEVERVLHAWTHYQGHDFWSPAHYVADQLGADRAVPLGIQQMCNGATAAVDVAVRELLTDPAAGCALVTTADRFGPPGFDRWGDLGVAYGDGATSVLVTREPHGPAARLLSSVTAAAPELEGMHRGAEPFGAVPRSGTERLRPRVAKRQFRADRPSADFGKTCRTVVSRLLDQAFGEAGIAPGDPRIAAVALPRLASHVLDEVYTPAVRDVCPAPVPELGRTSGHLGAGDALANLAELLPGAGRGDLFVLIGAGAGFTWSATVVEAAA
ncbi:ketoacyl-ACP synthase III family protein [Streptomyces sp. SCSIO ZS0520]|uniref:ketoacyl-ACP synthase III family protein n=1 Tax=Streptomyces sp. SCSIO ZS0520 TaxID=2892996 RepID=UPI0021D9737D|nr:ketoacyl-ACP synthase III family protein [Streptomyces sp. SCSIO ZS0520]